MHVIAHRHRSLHLTTGDQIRRRTSRQTHVLPTARTIRRMTSRTQSELILVLAHMDDTEVLIRHRRVDTIRLLLDRRHSEHERTDHTEHDAEQRTQVRNHTRTPLTHRLPVNSTITHHSSVLIRSRQWSTTPRRLRLACARSLAQTTPLHGITSPPTQHLTSIPLRSPASPPLLTQQHQLPTSKQKSTPQHHLLTATAASPITDIASIRVSSFFGLTYSPNQHLGRRSAPASNTSHITFTPFTLHTWRRNGGHTVPTSRTWDERHQHESGWTARYMADTDTRTALHSFCTHVEGRRWTAVVGSALTR